MAVSLNADHAVIDSFLGQLPVVVLTKKRGRERLFQAGNNVRCTYGLQEEALPSLCSGHGNLYVVEGNGITCTGPMFVWQ